MTAAARLAAVLALSPLALAACSNSELEDRVAKLEKNLAAREEALQFLEMAYEQTQEQQTKPEPGVVYGVDIQPNVEIGQVEGSPDALVTIVEAWDFA